MTYSSYPRTYKYLKRNRKRNILYFILMTVPFVTALVKYMDRITYVFTFTAKKVLEGLPGNIRADIAKDSFFNDETLYMLSMTAKNPSMLFIIGNIVVTLILMIFLFTGRRKGKPLSIYLGFNLCLHMISCIFFLTKPEKFPYSIGDFSMMYMKQEIGIGVAFIILYAAVTCFLGDRGYGKKVAAFFVLAGYWLIYGFARYVVFLYILHRFSMVYIVFMFFALGPLFDFLYMIMIYGFVVNGLVKDYKSEENGELWKWY